MFETSSKTYAEIEAGLAKGLRETRDDFRKKTRECAVLSPKDCKLVKGLTTLRDASMGKEKKMEGLKFQVALDASTIAHLETLVKDHRPNSHCMAVENGKL